MALALSIIYLAPGRTRREWRTAPFPFILALLALVTILVLASEAQAGSNDPQWSKSTSDDVVSSAMSDDGVYFAFGNNGGEIFLYDMESPGTAIVDFTANDEVLDVAISPDGRYLVAGSMDHNVYLFDRDGLIPSNPIYTYDTTYIVSEVDIDDDGIIFVAATADDSPDYLYFFENGGTDNPYRSQYIYGEANEISISGNGEYVGVAENRYIQYFTTDEDDTSHVWYKQAGQYNTANGISLNEDGTRVATVVSGGIIEMYNETGGTEWSSSTSEGDGFTAVATTPSALYTVAGDSKGVVYHYDVNGGEIFNYTTERGIMDVAISTDGKRFAAGSQDDKVYHFYPDVSSKAYWYYNTHNKVATVTVSSDGEWTGVGSWSEYAYYFDAEGVANVKPEATINSIEPDNGALVGEVVYFKGSSEDPDGGTVVEQEWSSDLDDVLSTEEDFNTDELSQGEHTISFKVRDDNGDWSDTVTETYVIHTAPTASIEDISPSPAFEGDEITFEADASDDREVARYIWSSDVDGEFYNGTSATITYDDLTQGTHDITLVVWDDLDEPSDPKVKRLDVREPQNQKPTAEIDSISPVGAYASDTVTFRGSGTDPDGEIRSYEWRSSIDNILGFSAKVDFPLSEGTHTIFFRVQDDDSEWSNTVQQSFTVKKRLVAVLTIQPETGNTEDTFVFIASNSQGNPSQYRWDLGDGTIIDWGASDTVTHQYEEANTYEVELSIRDADEREADDPALRTLMVKEPEPDLPTDTGNTDLSGDSPALGSPLVVGLMVLLALGLRRRRR